MSRWETTSRFEAELEPAAIWERAYADAAAWPKWNAEIRSAELDGPLAAEATARIVFRTGLRLRFRVVECEPGRLFTDEARLPGARMGHRHLIEPVGEAGSRLVNTIYIEGPLSALWRRIIGPAAARALPDAQRAATDLARDADEPTPRSRSKSQMGGTSSSRHRSTTGAASNVASSAKGPWVPAGQGDFGSSATRSVFGATDTFRTWKRLWTAPGT